MSRTFDPSAYLLAECAVCGGDIDVVTNETDVDAITLVCAHGHQFTVTHTALASRSGSPLRAKRKENRMITNPSLAALVVDDAVKMVAVKYSRCGTIYHFKSAIPDLKVGDKVITENAFEEGARGSGIAFVVDTDVPVNFNSDTQYKWLVQKVDVDALDMIKEREKVIIDKIRVAETMNYRSALKAQLLAALSVPEGALSITGPTAQAGAA